MNTFQGTCAIFRTYFHPTTQPHVQAINARTGDTSAQIPALYLVGESSFTASIIEYNNSAILRSGARAPYRVAVYYRQPHNTPPPSCEQPAFVNVFTESDTFLEYPYFGATTDDIRDACIACASNHTTRCSLKDLTPDITALTVPLSDWLDELVTVRPQTSDCAFKTASNAFC